MKNVVISLLPYMPISSSDVFNVFGPSLAGRRNNQSLVSRAYLEVMSALLLLLLGCCLMHKATVERRQYI
jgi:ABC-type nickel/cobalt efflux system permease component RcnA